MCVLPLESLKAGVLAQINTVGVGVAIGQACMLLSAGTKGKRFMLPHATGQCLPARPQAHPLLATCGACLMLGIDRELTEGVGLCSHVAAA